MYEINLMESTHHIPVMVERILDMEFMWPVREYLAYVWTLETQTLDAYNLGNFGAAFELLLVAALPALVFLWIDRVLIRRGDLTKESGRTRWCLWGAMILSCWALWYMDSWLFWPLAFVWALVWICSGVVASRKAGDMAAASMYALVSRMITAPCYFLLLYIGPRVLVSVIFLGLILLGVSSKGDAPKNNRRVNPQARLTAKILKSMFRR